MVAKLTHLDDTGKARMVDVTHKAATHRVARAEGRVHMQAQTLALIASGGHKKGDVLTVARIAGIQAAKKCAELIPLCHPLSLSSVSVDLSLEPDAQAVRIESCCKLTGQTGVEMEALTAVSVAALTLYDMCKAVDKGMTIDQVRLVYKSGGASGDWQVASSEPVEVQDE